MLRLEALEIRQGDFALSADWSLEKGQTLALIGPSGAGKSTLLSVIGGFFAAVSGRVLWDDQVLDPLAPGDRPVSTLFQDNNLFPHLTIAQNVGLGLRPNLRLTDTEKQQVSAVLARVGLAGTETRKPSQLSGGQQSRAALARVLIQNNPIVLLDEPFAALGPSLRTEMLDLVAETLADRTVLMVTHDPSDARRIADQVSIVAEGVAQAPVPTATALDAPVKALADYLGGNQR